MKIIVIGGSGLIGSRVVTDLASWGHLAVSASPETGVDTVTGQGLAAVLQGAEVVVDVSNSRAFDEASATAFFTTSTRNLLSQEAAAGVRHHVALSVVGAERPSEIGYFHAKNAQEKLIERSAIPYSIVHATQFFEFFQRIADDATDGDTVHLPPVLVQPIAADDVAQAVARVAVGSPLNGTLEVAGPEQLRFDEFVRKGLDARHDPRAVVPDPQALLYGAVPGERALVPRNGAQRAKTRFDDWLGRSSARGDR